MHAAALAPLHPAAHLEKHVRVVQLDAAVMARAADGRGERVHFHRSLLSSLRRFVAQSNIDTKTAPTNTPRKNIQIMSFSKRGRFRGSCSSRTPSRANDR